MVREFETSEPETALRAYLYLIGCAAYEKDNKKIGRTVTRSHLAQELGLQHVDLLIPLDLLTEWCKVNDLPVLPSLVVEPTGTPLHRFGNAAEQRVWDYEWFAIFPPTIEELLG